MPNGRTVENGSKRKEEPPSPSPTLLHSPNTLIFAVDQSWAYRLDAQQFLNQMKDASSS
jgi:hypothetical protein